MIDSSSKQMVLIVLLGVLLLCASFFLFLSDSHEPAYSPKEDRNLPPNPAPEKAEIIDKTKEADPIVSPNKEEDTLETEALKPEGLYLSGTVLEAESGQPITRYELGIHQWADGNNREERFRQTIRDEAGFFSIPLKQPGRYRVEVRASKYLSRRVDEITVSAPQGIKDLLIVLDKGRVLKGQVLDAKTKQPIQNALILPERISSGFDTTGVQETLNRILHGFSECAVHAFSDGQGRFELRGAPADHVNLMAFHPQYMAQVKDLYVSKDQETTLFLDKGFHIFGKVYDNSGAPLKGCQITVTQVKRVRVRRSNRKSKSSYSSRNFPSLTVYSGSDGSYKTPPVKPGRVTIKADPPEGSSQREYNFTSQSIRLSVKDQDMEVDFRPDPGLFSWRGRVLDPLGQPLPGVEITAYCTKSERYGEVFSRRSVTIAQGYFELNRLKEGDYRFYYKIPGILNRIPGGIKTITRSMDQKGEDIKLEGGVVKGQVVDGLTREPIMAPKAYIYARMTSRQGRRINYTVVVTSKGAFTIPCMAAGAYDLSLSSHRLNRRIHALKVNISNGQVIKDVKIPVSLQGEGRLVVLLQDFLWTDWQDFSLKLKQADKNMLKRLQGERRLSHREHERFGKVPAGDWILTALLKNVGAAVLDVHIDADKTTRITIKRSKLF